MMAYLYSRCTETLNYLKSSDRFLYALDVAFIMMGLLWLLTAIFYAMGKVEVSSLMIASLPLFVINVTQNLIKGKE